MITPCQCIQHSASLIWHIIPITFLTSPQQIVYSLFSVLKQLYSFEWNKCPDSRALPSDLNRTGRGQEWCQGLCLNSHRVKLPWTELGKIEGRAWLVGKIMRSVLDKICLTYLSDNSLELLSRQFDISMKFRRERQAAGIHLEIVIL